MLKPPVPDPRKRPESFLQRAALEGLRERHEDVFVGAQDDAGTLRVVALDGDEPGTIRWRVTEYAVEVDGTTAEVRPGEPYNPPPEEETMPNAA